MNISLANDGDNGQSVPLSDHILLVGKCERLEQERETLNTEVLQLRDALKQVNAGIHKASETKDGEGEIVLAVPTWRRAREIAMNLLHVPVGADNTSVIIEWRNNELVDIKTQQIQ